MHRFYVSPESVSGDCIEILGGSVHHIHHVLRLQPMDEVALFDGSGRQYVGRIVKMTSHVITVSVQHIDQPLDSRRASVTLVQAMPRHSKIESIIEKATELGVDRVIPIQTARTVPLLLGRAERMAARQARWQRIAIEAAQQSSRRTIPAIDSVKTLADVLPVCRVAALSLLAAVRPDTQPLWKVLEETGNVRSVVVLVGPEGDFTDEEVCDAQESGCRVISIGSTVLRCETAAVALLAMVNYATMR